MTQTDLAWGPAARAAALQARRQKAQQRQKTKAPNRFVKKRGPHPAIIDGVKVHVHLVKPVKYKGKPGFRTPDGNVWGSREDAVAHMTKTAKQRAAKQTRRR